MISAIYQIQCHANGKRILGSSQNIVRRFREHKNALRKGSHWNIRLQRAWDRYGEMSFSFQILFRCDPSDLVLFEQRAIDMMRPEFNMNRRANNRLGTKHSPEAKERMRLAKLGYRPWNVGKRLGPMSEQTRLRISQSQMGSSNHFFGKQHTVEAKQKMSEIASKRKLHPMLGKMHTEESKAKMRAALKGRVPWNKGMRGYKATPEVRAKMSADRKGRPWSLARRAAYERQF